MVFLFFVSVFFWHWFGVCGVAVLHIFGPEHYSSLLPSLSSFTTLVLQPLRLLRLSLLHYTILHYNCFSFCYTACRASWRLQQAFLLLRLGGFFYFVWLG